MNFFLDQLRGLGHGECRAIFGGHGLYRGRVFFAVIYRADSISRPTLTHAQLTWNWG